MLNRKKKQGLGLMIGGLVFAGIALILSLQKTEPVIEKEVKANISINEHVFELKTVSTEEERMKGLSGTEALGSNEGMLFVFENPHKPGIWMKEMNFPISIIWLDSECKVTGFKQLATPDSYPEVFFPEKLSSYVVEINPISEVLKIDSKLECNF